MLASDFFTIARLKEMRAEICEEGFIPDKFLADKPDSPMFGVNLACLYPFPTEVREVYEKLSAQLAALDSGVYVYPIWTTHVTIATFVNFGEHVSPTLQRIEELKNLTTQIVTQLKPWFMADREDSIKPFDLWIEQPVISRKAAILPLSDPSGAITQIRNRVAESLARNPSLRQRLDSLGLNIPPLIHSTVMRFKKVPADAQKFLSKFDEISRTVPRSAMRVNQIYITTETKPYMREGEILQPNL